MSSLHFILWGICVKMPFPVQRHKNTFCFPFLKMYLFLSIRGLMSAKSNQKLPNSAFHHCWCSIMHGQVYKGCCCESNSSTLKLLVILVIHYWAACLCMPFGGCVSDSERINLFSIEQFPSPVHKTKQKNKTKKNLCVALHWFFSEIKARAGNLHKRRYFTPLASQWLQQVKCVAWWMDKRMQAGEILSTSFLKTVLLGNLIFDFSYLELFLCNDPTYLEQFLWGMEWWKLQ